MKLPKYWNMPDMGSPALAPGVSKSNSLEIVNAPFLTAAGPGFVTYKKDGFTNIVLNGDSSTQPYLWTVVTRGTGATVDGPARLTNYSLLCNPEAGTVVEFTTNTNNRGVPNDKNAALPMRGYTGTDTAPGAGGDLPFATAIRIGGGWMLGATGSGLGDAATKWLASFSFERISPNYHAFLETEQGGASAAAGAEVGYAFTSFCAMGWDTHIKDYRWAVGYRAEVKLPLIETTGVWEKVHVDGRQEVRTGGECSGTFDTYPVISTSTVVETKHINAFHTELGVWTGTPTGVATKSIYYTTESESGRAYPPQIHSSGIACIGPGRLMAIVVRVGGGTVPSTFSRVDPIVVTLTDGFAPCFNAGYRKHDSGDIPNSTPEAEAFYAGVQVKEGFYPSLGANVYFSEDSGQSWSASDPLRVFGYDLPTSTPTGPTPLATSQNTAGKCVPSAAAFFSQYMWACYLGEGKTLVFMPGIDDTDGVDNSNSKPPPGTGCFLLEGTSARRVPWPGDTPGVMYPVGNERHRVHPGSFGVGCYTCMGEHGNMITTTDFGATWAVSGFAINNADPKDPWANPVVPAAIRSVEIGVKDGKRTVTRHARFRTIVPGVALAGPVGSLSVLRLSEITALSTDETFGFIQSTGSIRAPGKPTPIFPPTTDSGVGGTTTCVYYGEPGNRESPRPELGDEFAKPKKPK